MFRYERKWGDGVRSDEREERTSGYEPGQQIDNNHTYKYPYHQPSNSASMSDSKISFKIESLPKFEGHPLGRRY